jgi:uncharacterized repeat protein (TIGR02543 family)
MDVGLSPMSAIGQFNFGFPLAVSNAGTGLGSVTSTPAGIVCGAPCSTVLNAGSSVTLTATPANGYIFTGWKGDCVGTGTCTVTMSQARNVAAYFGAKAALTSPTPGSTLSGASITFTWGAGAGVTQYWLYIGSTPGGYDLYTHAFAPGTLSTGVTLPIDGRPLYARLHSQLNGGWQWTDYTFTAAP